MAGKLDNLLFPYVKETPASAPMPSSLRSPTPQPTSLRSQKPSWHRARSGVSQLEVRGRIIVFVVGGATFSELRESYQLSSTLNRDVYLGTLPLFPIQFFDRTFSLTQGSTHTITPRQFVDDLKVLELGGVGSRALPNGLHERQGTRTFQEFYDEKYYTKDAPPPQRAAPPSSRAALRERLEVPKMSPTNSLSPSVHSTATQSGKDEKKKKRGRIFGF